MTRDPFTLVAASLALTLALVADLACRGAVDGRGPQAPAAGKPSTTAAAPPPPVRLLVGAAVAHRPTFPVSGTLRPAAEVQLGFQVGGRLAAVLVPRGATVVRGQALLRLDERDVAAGVAQAEAAVAAAQAQQALASDAVGRLERGAAGGGISEAQLTQARLQLQAASAQSAQARAALLGARLQLEHHTLRAPFAGTVLLAPDAPGAIVGPGAPLVELADLGCLRLNASLPAEAGDQLVLGEALTLRRRDGSTLPARLARVLPALEPRQHRLPVEIEACDGTAGWGNAFVEASLAAGTPQAAVRLPVTVLTRAEQPTLFVREGADRVRRRVVPLLARERGWVVVGGLAAGVPVVDLPAEDLVDGAVVTPGRVEQVPASGEISGEGEVSHPAVAPDPVR